MMVDPSKQVRLRFVNGLVSRKKSMAFERILFRATRGNVFLRQSVLDFPVIDPAFDQKVEKNVLVIFYSGERATNKIVKNCEAFGANRYHFSDDPERQQQMLIEEKPVQ